MAITADVISIHEQSIVPELREAGKKLGPGADLVLDFAAVRRIDSSAMKALDELAGIADAKAVKVVLRGVSVEVYKALKLVKLTQRFSFEN